MSGTSHPSVRAGGFRLLRGVVMFLAVLMTACSCARHSLLGPSNPSAEVGPDEVVVKVTAVGFDDFTQAHFVMLSSEDQEHQLPILIGDSEADAIQRALHGVQLERPLTHDLIRSIIQDTGNHVDCVSISDMREEVYYATIYLNRGKTRIDSRPSDAIAIASSLRVPIFVARKLFEEGPAGPGLRAKYSPRTETAMDITVEELTPALAQYFHVQKGVLVANVGQNASKNGLERGDIITNVGSRSIGSPADFRAGIDAETSSTILLRVNHNGAEHNISLPH